ncbi:MAG: hypothetical protein EPO07_04335 [Verrucomicrobia bacterium]|nr:MAG: hypothetical protein EPO07_04335 [Verrucomicrobiota bacterium]
MKDKSSSHQHGIPGDQDSNKRRQPGWKTRLIVAALSVVAVATLMYSALADAPVLSFVPLGSNQFNIVITNAVTTTNYTLFWTPSLAEDPNYPWQVWESGVTGQTNFSVNAGEWPVGFFRVMVGGDADGDGIPEWQDAQSFNPNVGILNITIDSPVNGSTLN